MKRTNKFNMRMEKNDQDYNKTEDEQDERK